MSSDGGFASSIRAPWKGVSTPSWQGCYCHGGGITDSIAASQDWVGDEWPGSKGPGEGRRQVVRLERTWLECRMSGWDQKGLVEEDKWSGLKGHGWSIGQLIEVKKAWWRQQTSSQD